MITTEIPFDRLPDSVGCSKHDNLMKFTSEQEWVALVAEFPEIPQRLVLCGEIMLRRTHECRMEQKYGLSAYHRPAIARCCRKLKNWKPMPNTVREFAIRLWWYRRQLALEGIDYPNFLFTGVRE